MALGYRTSVGHIALILGLLTHILAKGELCQPPISTTEWQEDLQDSNVTVEWGYGKLTCNTLEGCGYPDDHPKEHMEPQLKPIEIQKGTTLVFVPSHNMGVPFPIQPYRVDEKGYKDCNISRGVPVIAGETNDSFVVPSEFLSVGVNYFIVNLNDDLLIQCEFGLRLNVTVKDEICHHDNVICSARGNCVTRKGQANYSCSCCPRFKGDYCEEFDSCLSRPCKNGASCEHSPKGSAGYVCHCRMGYYGPLCENRYDNLCKMSPCENNGTCIGNHDSFKCTCVPGYTGSHCEVNINECEPRPCVHGLCVDKQRGYQCYCVPGYHGDKCHLQYDECLSNPCHNGGKCIGGVDTASCHCHPGFTGEHCDTEVDVCKPNPCTNRAKCEPDANQRRYRCHCHPGFTGTHCEVNINECRSHPCMNGGTCKDLVNGYTCLCHDMHAGPNCEYTLDMFAPILQGKPGEQTDANHVRNLYIVAGTLSGAILIVVVVLAGCYCRMHESYKMFSLRRLKYRRHKDNSPDSACDVSSVARPRLSIDAIWEATSLSYDTNQLNSPLHQQSLKPRKV